MKLKEYIKQKWLTSWKLNCLRKEFYKITRPNKNPKVIFIFGCQRSGTTMTSEVFRLSPFVQHYGEGDAPYFYQGEHPKHLCLKDKDELLRLMAKERSRFVLLKPLYDTGRAKDLLDIFPNSRAIWIFRHYLSVVDSHMKYYKGNHDGLSYTQDLLLRKELTWKNENLPEAMKSTLDEFSGEEFNSATGYALFWLARNSLYSHVRNNENVLLINYEELVKRPEKGLKQVFEFLDVPFKTKYSSVVHDKASKKTITFDIKPRVRELCDEMYDKLMGECTRIQEH